MAGILLLVVAAYQPVFRAGFIWDDDAHVTAPALRSGHGLARIWSEPGATQQYYPLLHSVFWLEHRLIATGIFKWFEHRVGGTSAFPYHLFNLLWHVGAAWLVGRVLRQLAVPGAWLAAALFALHPVHVESVAWISEQKNTLSTIFYLAALSVYLRFDVDRRRTAYISATVLFVCALLTKSVTATLPAAILVLIWWRRGSISWRRDVRPLLPWFITGILSGLFTAWMERNFIGAEGVAFDFTVLQRTALAGRVWWFYLDKLLWPVPLIFIYPRWTINASTLVTWLPLVGALLLLGALWIRRRRSRASLAATLIFTGTLFPVLGFFNVFPFIYSFVADHFQYLASIAVLALAATALARGRERASGVIRPLLAGVALAWLAVLSAITWRQAQNYQNAETLYRATIDQNPSCWMAFNNLGKELMGDRRRLAEAVEYFQRALQLRPDYFEAETNLGLVLVQLGHPREAVPHLQAAVHLRPGAYVTHNNLGIALASTGNHWAAVQAFAAAARLNPAMPNLQENWAKALLLVGRKEESAAHFALAAKLRAKLSLQD
jgi:protein O-mannosyl-transferase